MCHIFELFNLTSNSNTFSEHTIIFLSRDPVCTTTVWELEWAHPPTSTPSPFCSLVFSQPHSGSWLTNHNGGSPHGWCWTKSTNLEFCAWLGRDSDLSAAFKAVNICSWWIKLYFNLPFLVSGFYRTVITAQLFHISTMNEWTSDWCIFFSSPNMYSSIMGHLSFCDSM